MDVVMVLINNIYKKYAKKKESREKNTCIHEIVLISLRSCVRQAMKQEVAGTGDTPDPVF